MGKYAALMAMGTFMILNPKKAQATLHNLCQLYQSSIVNRQQSL